MRLHNGDEPLAEILIFHGAASHHGRRRRTAADFARDAGHETLAARLAPA